MTNAQLQALKADLAANTNTVLINGNAVQIKNVPAGSDNDAVVASWYNQAASPDYLAWRTSVPRDQVQADPAYDWTRVDNLSVGKSRIWDSMFGQADTLMPSRGNVRTGINAVWVGTQADLDVRASVLGVCRRKVTNGERVFVSATVGGPSQTGNRGSSTNPDTLGFEGAVGGNDIDAARNAS